MLAWFLASSCQSKILNMWRPMQLEDHHLGSWQGNAHVPIISKSAIYSHFFSLFEFLFLRTCRLDFFHQCLNQKVYTCSIRLENQLVSSLHQNLVRKFQKLLLILLVYLAIKFYISRSQQAWFHQCLNRKIYSFQGVIVWIIIDFVSFIRILMWKFQKVSLILIISVFKL